MRPMLAITLSLAAMLASAAPVCAAPSAEPLYKLVASVPLGAGDRWDYVTYDSYSHRVFVAHGDHVSVVDADKRVVVGQVGPLPGGTHGIALSTGDGIGYTDDGKAGTAAAFDPKSLKIIKQLPTAPDADGIVFDTVSKNMFVINGDSGSITVINPKTDVALTTIKIGAGLEAAASDESGHLFVDGAEQNDIIKIDTGSNAILAHFPMPGCERPHGIAVDGETHRVFATCVNKVMVVMDGDTGQNIATLPIGAYSDGAAFDPRRKLAISPNGEGTLTVVKETGPNSFTVLGTVTTAPSARTIAINPENGNLYLPAADIAKIDPPATPGGRPHVTFAPGSLKLLVFSPLS